jgi:mRNA-degrading endonuclease RelE of RelBE toxin-antitoxin system
MKIFQSKSFEKKVKKISKNDKEELDNAIYAVIKSPEIGTEKKGDLVKIFVYKYKVKNQQYLLAYRFTGVDLELVKIDVHQNFYRDLKKQIKH